MALTFTGSIVRFASISTAEGRENRGAVAQCKQRP